MTDILMQRPMFYVFSIPRSGTTWLSRYIAACNPEWMICHEAHVTDFQYDIIAPFRPWEADEYVNGPRHERLLTYTKRHFKDPHGYGEVTPRCRYFSAAIQRRYPHARCVHLVRDPRKAIRSLIQYGYCDENSRAHRKVAPDGGKWSKVNRTAWMWAFGHQRIRTTCDPFVRFEDLLEDYDAMDALCSMIGVESKRSVWEKWLPDRVNVSKETMPPWSEWPTGDREEVNRMCGSEARQYGYLTNGS